VADGNIGVLREHASGLRFPEGPVALQDGSLLVVEMARGTLTRIFDSGRLEVVAHVGGGPNGAAIGPDGRCYVCNNGGVSFRTINGRTLPGFPPAGYEGGWIDVVDINTGRVERLYETCNGTQLNAPNDLVFDSAGGFWFTDMGKTHQSQRQRDQGALYYARANGSRITEALFPLDGPNGIGLSPDETTLYVAESVTGRLWAFELAGPGAIRDYSRLPPWQRGRLHWTPGRYAMLDSLCIDDEGFAYVGDIPYGGISVISPQGQLHGRIPTLDALTTNACFGGEDLRTLYITLSSTGKVVSTSSERRGLRLHWSGL